MNHRHIEESNIVDYYLQGKLPPEEQARFEEHFVDCSECLEQLETVRDFRRGLKIAVAQDAGWSNAYVRAGLLGWLIKRSRRQWTVLLLTTVLLLVCLPAALFGLKIRRLQNELAQAQKASSEWQHQYEEQQQSASQLEKELQETRASLNEQRRQRETQNELGLPAPPDERKAVNQAERPQAGVAIFALSIVRSADPGAEPVNKIAITRSTRSVVLSLELENNSEARSYRATISTSDYRVIWQASNLKPQARDNLRINLTSKLLKAGDYQLTLEGLTQAGRYVPEGKYAFRVREIE